MQPTWFQYVPSDLQHHAQRLLDVSPFFLHLMKDADAAACQKLFQPAERCMLPKHDAAWLPISESDDLACCLVHLRHLKRNAMRHILWWELGVHGSVETSYHAITQLAEGLLEQSIDMAKRLIQPRFGGINDGQFCIIGLGKLGGQELNLGSDVDPLFIWQADGMSEGGRVCVRANEYYSHLSRMLIKLLSEHTVDGLAWIIDMRLRPGGDGSPICLNLDATLNHYLEYGQTWERAMLIKARPVAGSRGLGEHFIQAIRPFIYRRYLDYSSVNALAEMKHRIDQQAGNIEVGVGFDVKRGHGGIREIEFTIQALQLLHGGRDSALQQHEGQCALDNLVQKAWIPEADARKLFQHYLFWRRIEHALQARKGEQTHTLAKDYIDYLQQVLNLQHIQQAMLDVSAAVSHIFHHYVLPIEDNQSLRLPSWIDNPSLLHQADLEASIKASYQQSLHAIDQQLSRGLLPERSRQQIDHMLYIAMPLWLKDANGCQALRAFSDLLHNISGRATWIDLLATEKGTLTWLIGVLSASRYVAEHIVKNPSWLEWPLSHQHMQHDIHQICRNIDMLDGRDEESFLAQLGQYTDHGRMYCALNIDAHQMQTQAIGKALAQLADAAVRACLRSSLLQLKLPDDFPLLALAMGKHGSCEMGLVSDLDMVFILAGDANTDMHDRSAREWAQRLGRRIIRQLSGQPPFGAGYEFDARLRPSGNSGVLVTTLIGFESYQRQEAQTWEHQALCRARIVTGTVEQRQELQTILKNILQMPRDTKQLAQDVLEMREKILDHLSSKKSDIINLKHDAGGLVDIEFLAQYARLAWAGEHLGTSQSLLNLATKAPQAWREAAALLSQTYLDYRNMENALRVELWQSIGKLSTDSHAPEWETMRRHCSIQSPQALSQRMQKVHQLFHLLLA